jgi:hypothetical protein
MMRLPRPLAVLTRLGFTVLAGSSLLAAAGCATQSGVRAKTVVFSITYSGDCPTGVSSSSPCGGNVTDCAMVKGGDATVEFRAIGTGAKDREFKVQFDPFRETGINSKGGGTTKPVPVRVAHSGNNTSNKEFTFFIVDLKNKACAPLDPRIIVEK